MNDLGPGWVERAVAAQASKTDDERSEAQGYKPRRIWRGNGDVRQESRLRGARARKRPLPRVDFQGDE